MNNDIILKIRAERKKKNLTQDKVAKSMGTTGSAIARLENGGGARSHSPSLKTLQGYAAAVGLFVKMELVEHEDASNVEA